MRKRLGFAKTAVYDGRINGRFSLDGTDIIHAGTKLYAGDTLISSAMNDAFSVGKNFDKALYLLDGAHYYKVTHSDGTFTVANVSDSAYVPRIVINKIRMVPAEQLMRISTSCRISGRNLSM